jgi:hypothetical protein
VISGTHGSGKSTLIGDFAMSHREWTILPDPYEYIDVAEEVPGAAVFYQQLRIAAERLFEPTAGSAMAERGPLDFLAYLSALDSLGRTRESSSFFEEGHQLTSRAMAEVDVLILLPLNVADSIAIGADEDLELRDAMDTSLLELADDPDLTGTTHVVEITGDRGQRLARLEDVIGELDRGASRAR